MLLSLVFVLLAQFSQVNVPDAVLDQFQNKFEEVDVDFINWEKKWGKYIAKFVNDDNIKVEAFFSGDKSNWLYTREEVFFSSVDDRIMDSFANSKYANSKLLEITIIRMPKGKTYYEFEVEIFDFKKSVYFDHQGSIVDLKLK